jgi:hypothetical protein
MQVLSTLILQFIFIYLSLIIGVPGTDKYNIMKNKLILFSGIFIFQTLIKSISRVRIGCKVSLKNILIDSFLVGLVSVVGYSFYIDLSLVNSTKSLYNQFSSNPQMSALAISGIITGFILAIRIVQILIQGTIDECEEENEIY